MTSKKMARATNTGTLLAALLALGCSAEISAPGGAAGSAAVTPPGGVGGAATAAGGASTAGASSATGGTTTGAGGAGSGGTVAATGGNVGVAGMPPDPGTSTPESAGELPMLRLTRAQYNHALSDLIGDQSSPGDTLPDDGVSNNGFEAPISTSSLHVQYLLEIAEAAVDSALADGRLTIPCNNPAAAQEEACATQFIDDFGLRVYRRPIEPDERTGLLSVFTQARELELSVNDSIGFMLKAMLQSPNFLYHWEIGDTKPGPGTDGLVPLTEYQVASRLAYFLWDSGPDDALLTSAGANQLTTPDGVLAQAQRLLTDTTRADRALSNFHTQWLHVYNLGDLQKDTGAYPSYGPEMRSALEPAMTSFVSSVFLGAGDGTLATLLSAPYAYANAALAPAYGTTVTGTSMQRIDLDPTQRAGLLTQAAFLATNASPQTSHPVLRGLTVWKNLLCGPISPPPANVPEVEPPAAGTTTRQRYENHSANPCATCHTVFDPLGFAFENYDAIGGFRATENGQPVDATGVATTPGGTMIPFNNAVELLGSLASNDEVRWCVTRQWFRYMLGRMEASAEQGSMEVSYYQALATPGFSLRDLLLKTVQTTAFRFRAPSAGETF